MLDGIRAIHVLVALLVISSAVLLLTVGPDLRAQFVSFEAGDELVWSKTGRPLGTVLTVEHQHVFPNGSASKAYQIRPADGEGPVWYPARDVERYCDTR
jgi:hypothetical protein